MQQIRKCWQLMLGLGVLFTSQAWAVFEFEPPVVPAIKASTPDAVLFAVPLAAPALAPGPLDSFDSFEAPSAGNTIIGTPTPGTAQGWNGPWQNNSSYGASDTKYVTSKDQAYDGSQSLKLTESRPSGGFIEADRPTKNAVNGGVGYAGYTIDTYVFIPANVVNANAMVYFAVYTIPGLGGAQSASLNTGVSGSSVNWFVYDNGAYRDTGVAVTSYADTWAKLTLDLDMTTQTYKAYLNDVAVLSGQSLSFGSGSSTNLYGVGYAFSNTADKDRSVYFDALLIRPKPKVPEAPSWLALVGFLGAGLLPVGWRRFRS